MNGGNSIASSEAERGAHGQAATQGFASRDGAYRRDPCAGARSEDLAQGTIAFTSTSVSGVLADGLAAGPDGSLWSVNQTLNTVGHVTFPDLHVSTFDALTPDAGLSGITAGPDGNLWFTETTARKIGRITASGAISEFSIPANAASPQRIFSGPNGSLWSFNACIFYGCSRFLVTTTAGTSTEISLQVPGAASFAPANCTLGADGNVWCTGSETTPSPFSSQFKVARISPTGGYTAFVPSKGFQGAAIVAAPDGNVWYTWEEAGSSTGVARVSPTGVITVFTVPTGKTQSWIFGLAVGADGNLYFADRQTSILYELVLSTATDSGTATINSGTIGIDIPEDIAAVSSQAGVSSGIHTAEAAAASCPAGAAFIVRSGGSLFGGITWVETTAPSECTDMLAAGKVDRFAQTFTLNTSQATASCSVKPKDSTTGLPNPASSPTLTIETSQNGFALLENAVPTGWTECLSFDEKSTLQCSSTQMLQPGATFSVTFDFVNNGTFDTTITVTCASSTAEMTPLDNSKTVDLVPGLPAAQEPAVDTSTRRSQ